MIVRLSDCVSRLSNWPIPGFSLSARSLYHVSCKILSYPAAPRANVSWELREPQFLPFPHEDLLKNVLFEQFNDHVQDEREEQNRMEQLNDHWSYKGKERNRTEEKRTELNNSMTLWFAKWEGETERKRKEEIGSMTMWLTSKKEKQNKTEKQNYQMTTLLARGEGGTEQMRKKQNGTIQ